MLACFKLIDYINQRGRKRGREYCVFFLNDDDDDDDDTPCPKQGREGKREKCNQVKWKALVPTSSHLSRSLSLSSKPKPKPKAKAKAKGSDDD